MDRGRKSALTSLHMSVLIGAVSKFEVRGGASGGTREASKNNLYLATFAVTTDFGMCTVLNNINSICYYLLFLCSLLNISITTMSFF